MSLVTRLAPSPTGALHLGNARTFLVNWAMARTAGWKIVLRIEDLDTTRNKAGSVDLTLEDLRWLGIDWDEGPTFQSQRSDIYREAIEFLLARRLAYPCVCTRREIELATSAPHAEDASPIYPGTCRGRFTSVAAAGRSVGRGPAIRFAMPPRVVDFVDLCAGPQTFDLQTQLGDFVIGKAEGSAGYQLAVVVDDIAAGVTHVVRGDDLLDSTPRQMMIYESLLKSSLIPTYIHVPLVVGHDGKRLAKRHGDTRLAALRESGAPASRMLGLLGRWCGIVGQPVRSASEFADRFSLDRLPRRPIQVSDADLVFLSHG